LHEKLKELTDGHGPDIIIEAVGRPETFQAAVEHVGFAGRVVYIGYAKSPVEYETKLFVLKELDILGSRNALPEDFASVVAHLEEKRVPVDNIISHSVALAEAGAMLAQWSENPGQFVKILVDLNV
jgi:threonine dehydrogenase-like Zn-dependent dehydrogenase